MLVIVCYNFVKIMGARMCILMWPKKEKQKTVFDLLSAVAQKKKFITEEECILVNLRKAEREREEP